MRCALGAPITRRTTVAGGYKSAILTRSPYSSSHSLYFDWSRFGTLARMPDHTTHWTMIQRAAAGSTDAREAFARRYSPVIRAYLGSRWRTTPLLREIDDATQQVFVQCFKEGGALGRADPERETGFRAFLYGVVRNVALGIERQRARTKEQQSDSRFDFASLASNEDSLAMVFDRAWAGAILAEAADLQLERARAVGPEAVRRHELLALRFGNGLPIREIANRWGADPAGLHREYAKAREEFRRAMRDVLRERQGGGPEGIDGEIERLRGYFS